MPSLDSREDDMRQAYDFFEERLEREGER